MKNKSKFMIIPLIMLLMVLALHTYNVSAKGAAFDYVKKLGNGLNLGNTFETGMEDVILDGSMETNIVSNIKGQGFTSIRVPITWEGHWDEESGVIDALYLAKVKSLVDAAVKQDLCVVLTMYDDSWKWIADAKNAKENLCIYESLWKQIANFFQGYDARVSFEAVNAPGFSDGEWKEQLNLLDKFNQKFVETVRGAGGSNKERFLLLPILHGQVNEDTCQTMVSFYKKIKDDKLIVSTQYYGLWNFSVNAAGTITFNKDAKQHMDNYFATLKTYLTKNSIPVICSEYGLYGYPLYKDAINRGERLKYFNEFTTQASKVCLSHFLWDTGAIYNRGINKWSDEDLAYIIKNASKAEYSYGSKDAVYCIDGQKSKDVDINFSLHKGNITTVSYNGQAMKQEQYKVNKDKVTFTKAFWESLTSNKYGAIGTIEVRFSKGPAWKIVVSHVATPQMKASGCKEGMWSIPMDMKGNEVSAMEAFDKDNKVVGPLDWTSYQEYGYSFEPDYTTQTMCLTEEFIDSLPKNKEITLRFHFRSGQKATYTIVKEAEGVREVSYDWKNEAEIVPTPTKDPDLKSKVEQENQKAIQLERVKKQVKEQAKKDTTDRNTTGWKLLLISFSIMVVLGFAIVYIYYAHRMDRLDEIYDLTEDGIERRIQKILVDKFG